jgi:hypothetical protein
MAERFTCPRRHEVGSHVPPLGTPDADKWREDGTCAYCGSLSPERFFELVEAGAEVTPTDKDYKAYIRPGGSARDLKFYFQHLDEAGRDRFVELHNSKRMRLGVPGHFYRRPYFAVPQGTGGDA